MLTETTGRNVTTARANHVYAMSPNPPITLDDWRNVNAHPLNDPLAHSIDGKMSAPPTAEKLKPITRERPPPIDSANETRLKHPNPATVDDATKLSNHLHTSINRAN